MSLLPLRGESQSTPGETRVLGLTEEAADEAFEALTAATTRRVLSIIYEQPSTPTEIREEIDTSLQNVHYHLGKLEDAKLIEPAGVGYSEKGTEMTVYAPANEAVVLFAGRESDRLRLRDFVSRIFGALALLAGATLLLAWYLGSQLLPGDGSTADSGGGGDVGIQEVTPSGEGIAQTAPALDPALAFFLGGVFVLVLVGTAWYLSR